MNFTKPGISGGRGYNSKEHSMRIVVKSKKRNIEQENGGNQWENIVNSPTQCSYIKTNVQRRKKDVIAAGNDSD